jgi:hypothetical protein
MAAPGVHLAPCFPARVAAHLPQKQATPAALALAPPLLARRRANLAAPRAPRSAVLLPERRRHPQELPSYRRSPQLSAAQAPAPPLKVWESSRLPARAPGQERGSAPRAALFQPHSALAHDAPPRIPGQSTARRAPPARTRSPAARPHRALPRYLAHAPYAPVPRRQNIPACAAYRPLTSTLKPLAAASHHPMPRPSN